MEQDIWGLCHIDPDVNPQFAGYQGGKWLTFDSRDEAIEYLLGEYLRLLANVGELDERQLQMAHSRFSLLIEQYSDDIAMIEALNDLTEGLRHIVWFGPLSMLAELHEPFACDMRRYYWMEYGDGSEDDPEAQIPPEYWDDLLEAIEDYLANLGYGGY